jgi:hypothetical protein
LINFIYGLPTITMAFFVVGGMVAASILGLALSRLLIKHHVLTPHHDVAGYTYAAVGVVYAVLLAFVAISVWDTFGRAETLVREEASAMGKLFRDAGFLPREKGGPIRTRLIAHARANIEKEWPAMSQGNLSLESTVTFEELSNAIGNVEPATPKEQIVYQSLFSEFNELVGRRDTRRFLANNGLHPIIWGVLVAGAAIFVGFTYFFGLPSFRLQAAMTAGVAATIGIVFVLIIAMDYPFRGELCVPASDFKELLIFWGIPPDS